MSDIVRAQVIGSLLDPPGDVSATADVDAAVRAAIALQEKIGFEVVTDGELRRGFFFEPLAAAVEGLAPPGAPAVPWLAADPADDFDEELPICVAARLGDSGVRPSLDEAHFAAGLAPRLKVALPSPFFFCQLWSPEVSAQAYPDPFEMFAAAAAILRHQVEGLAELGVAEIQIDADELGVLVDPTVRERYAASGLDPERLLTEGADLLGDLVAGIETPTGLHMCRGNFKGLHMAAGDWEAIAPTIFPRLSAFDSLLLEFDGPRCGSFVGLRHVLPEQAVVLGLVSTKEPPRLGPEQVAARVREASRYVPLERLAISPAAGFAPAPEGNPLTPADQERALRLVVEAAEVIW
ncbi:MAG: hypothetical protein QM729_12855 [Solirubrobacterales bacterium]